MNDVVDREALLIYLNDLRTMESVLHESEKNKEILLVNFERKLKENNEKLENEKPKDPVILSETTSIFKLIMGLGLAWAIIFVIFGIGFKWKWLVICGIIVGVLTFIRGIKELYDNKKSNDFMERENIRAQNEYDQQLEKYENLKQEIKKAEEEITNKGNNDIQLLKADINSMKQMLDRAYSANIIPMQFRNIQGIYYLYDYMSTSNQSLSEALMQCNLEAIKEKLDKMIELQCNMIIQQAESNEMMIRQNEHIIQHLVEVNKNTAAAAYYSKIAAVNSELSLRLQEKSLAYQIADFWLN